MQDVCPDYPVLSYTVVLEDAGGAQRTMVTGNSTDINIDGLAEDMGYTYHIRAANQFGNSNDSSPVKLCKQFAHLFLILFEADTF